MTQIPDADYIREAEQKGVPPYDEPDLSDVYTDLVLADGWLDKVTDLLLQAEDKVPDTEYADDIRSLMRQVEAVESAVYKTIKKFKGGL